MGPAKEIPQEKKKRNRMICWLESEWRGLVPLYAVQRSKGLEPYMAARKAQTDAVVSGKLSKSRKRNFESNDTARSFEDRYQTYQAWVEPFLPKDEDKQPAPVEEQRLEQIPLPFADETTTETEPGEGSVLRKMIREELRKLL